MKLEDKEARMALFDLEDRLAKSNEDVIHAINNLRLSIVGSAWIIVIAMALCTWLG